MKNLLFLFLLLTLFVLSGCSGNSPEISLAGGGPITEPSPVPSPSPDEQVPEITTTSLEDISGDVVGESKATPIEISNPTNITINIVYETPEPPFYLNSGSCGEQLSPGNSCNLELVFDPDDNLIYNIVLLILGQQVPVSAKAEFPQIASANLVCTEEVISFDGANGIPLNTNCEVNSVIDETGIQLTNYTVESKTFIDGVEINSWQTSGDEIFSVANNGNNENLLLTSTITSDKGSTFVLSKKIKVVGNSKVSHSGDNYKLYLGFFEQNNTIEATFDEWDRYFSDFSKIAEHDNSFFGVERSFTHQFRDVSVSNFPRYSPECLVGVKDYLLIAPCTKETVTGLDFSSPIKIKSNKIATSQAGYFFPQFYTIGDDSQVPNYETTLDGQSLLGAASFYDEKSDSLHIFGGSYLEDKNSDGNLSITPNLKAIKYNNISNFDNTVSLEEVIYSYQDNFPVYKSYSKGVNRSFAFGGMGLVLQGESEYQAFSNDLIKFENSDITLVEAQNKPSKRYLAGMFYHETTEQLYLFGGLDENSNPLGDLWKLDLKQETPTWVKLEDGLNLTHNYSLVDRIVTTFGLPEIDANFSSIRNEYVTKQEYKNFLSDARPLGAYYDSTSRSVIMQNSNGDIVGRVGIDTDAFSSLSVHFAMGKEIFYNSSNFRYYKITPFSDSESKISFTDSLIRYQSVYRVSVQLDDTTIEKIQTLKPVTVARAYNFRPEINGSRGDVASSIFNFSTNRWEIFGYSDRIVPSTPAEIHTEIKNNPHDYISDEGRVEIRIEPFFVNSGGHYYYLLEIDHVSLEGVF